MLCKTSMRPLWAASLLCSALLAGTAAQASGSAQVKWLEPEHYADAGRNVVDRERTLDMLTMHFRHLAQRLPDGQTLQVEVTDLDLAGELDPTGLHDLRILRGRADWPHMSLRWTLREGERTLTSGQSELADMNYFYRARPDALGYEKRMLSDWFRATFEAH